MQASSSCRRDFPRLSRTIGLRTVKLLLTVFLFVSATVGCGSTTDPEPTAPTGPLKIIDGEELPS